MIKVARKVVTTPWQIQKHLDSLYHVPDMSFDIETSGLYSKEERKEALKLIDKDLSLAQHKLVSIVANNSGLSFPSLTRTTHFIFGLSREKSIILVPPSFHSELLIWNWLITYPGILYIHNSLFDLKVMYHRVKALPRNFEDTAIMVKTLINNSDVWKAKIGLKDLMGAHYAPAWSLFDTYEPDSPVDPAFLDYAAIDGAATYHLHELILEKS